MYNRVVPKFHALIYFAHRQLCQGLTGILQELVRQKMTNILVQVAFSNLTNILGDHYPQKCSW